MIEIQQLSKSFGDKSILRNISASFLGGRAYGIVGANGAGKSTLFRCIAGLESHKGEICSAHTPLKDHLGYLLAEQYFLPRITGQEYLTLLAEAREKRITDLLDRNIFDLPLHAYVSTYSTGMKKKLAIMGILLQDNNYFILDEPYNGLDLQSSMMLTEIITRLKAMGKTILISSHIFSTLTETCDEMFLLQDGAFLKHIDHADFGRLEEELKENLLAKDLDKLFGN